MHMSQAVNPHHQSIYNYFDRSVDPIRRWHHTRQFLKAAGRVSDTDVCCWLFFVVVGEYSILLQPEGPRR